MGLGENVVFVDDETLDADSFHFFIITNGLLERV